MTDWAAWFAHCLFLRLSLYQPVLLPQGLSGKVLLSVFFFVCFATQLSSLPSAIYSPKLLTVDILLRVRYLSFFSVVSLFPMHIVSLPSTSLSVCSVWPLLLNRLVACIMFSLLNHLSRGRMSPQRNASVWRNQYILLIPLQNTVIIANMHEI
jgi:hypothetical protein